AAAQTDALSEGETPHAGADAMAPDEQTQRYVELVQRNWRGNIHPVEGVAVGQLFRVGETGATISPEEVNWLQNHSMQQLFQKTEDPGPLGKLARFVAERFAMTHTGSVHLPEGGTFTHDFAKGELTRALGNDSGEMAEGYLGYNHSYITGETRGSWGESAAAASAAAGGSEATEAVPPAEGEALSAEAAAAAVPEPSAEASQLSQDLRTRLASHGSNPEQSEVVQDVKLLIPPGQTRSVALDNGEALLKRTSSATGDRVLVKFSGATRFVSLSGAILQEFLNHLAKRGT
ncbi:MAG: hypothetical protein ABIG71_04400, partial [Candidatus Uhrbacteria bacterium]